MPPSGQPVTSLRAHTADEATGEAAPSAPPAGAGWVAKHGATGSQGGDAHSVHGGSSASLAQSAFDDYGDEFEPDHPLD